MNNLLCEFLTETGGSPDAKPMTIGIDQRNQFYGQMIGVISEVLRLDIEARDINPFNFDSAMELAA